MFVQSLWQKISKNDVANKSVTGKSHLKIFINLMGTCSECIIIKDTHRNKIMS